MGIMRKWRGSKRKRIFTVGALIVSGIISGAVLTKIALAGEPQIVYCLYVASQPPPSTCNAFHLCAHGQYIYDTFVLKGTQCPSHNIMECGVAAVYLGQFTGTCP